MRILLLQDQLRSGGTERQTLFLAAHLRRQGHDARLVVFRPGGRLAEEPARLGIPCQLLQRFDSGIAVWAPGLIPTVRALAPAVVICLGRSANLYAGRLQRALPDVPVVATVRTGKTLLPPQRRALRQVRAIWVNSQWWGRELRRLGLAPERITVIHNPLLDAFEPLSERERQTLRARLGAEPEERVLVQVANFRAGKGQAELIDLLRELQQEAPGIRWKLWLLGEGPHLRRCQARARDLPPGQVVFWGYQADPRPYLQAADLAVSLSQEESLPNFLIEAQAAGLPVVARACRGVEECVDPGRSGWVFPVEQTAGLRQQVRTLADQAEVRQRAGVAARAHAAETFAPERQAARIQSFLEELAGAPAKLACLQAQD